MTTNICAYPGCTYDDSAHRPYARKRDIPSVTAISSLLDAGKARSFGWAASLIAATTAVHETPRWWGLPTSPCSHDIRVEPGLCKACGFLRSEFDRQWTAKAVLGSHIHHMALSWALGDAVDTDEVTEPYMDALELFHVEQLPDFVELERTVRYDDADSRDYRGQFDFMAYTGECPDERRLGMWDIKTGSFHPVEQTLQLAAYRYATNFTHWEALDKRGKPMETVECHTPAVAEAGVLLLGEDGDYQLIPLPADEKAFRMFLGLRECWEWGREIDKWDKQRKGEANAPE